MGGAAVVIIYNKTMIKIFNNYYFKSIGIVWILILYFSGVSYSYGATFIPTAISGSLSYGYGYNRAGDGGESETQNINLTLGGGGYFWQPWFIQTSASVALGFSRSDSSTSSNTGKSETWGGGLSFNVFPVSRFPFSLSISHSNSLMGSTDYGSTSEREFKSTRVLATQSYIARTGWNSYLSYTLGRFDTESVVATNEVVNFSSRKLYEKSSLLLTANYSTTDESNSTRKPENYSISLNNHYIPGNQFGITNMASAAESKSKGAGFSSKVQTLQAASSFSWRPEYKPYSFSGGVRISAITSDQQQVGGAAQGSDTNTASLGLGVNYRLTRKIALRMNGSGSSSFEDTDGSETTRTTGSFSIGTSYGSDQYSIGGFQYGWNMGVGAGISTTDVKTDESNGAEDESGETSNAGLSLGHALSRSWTPGRSSTLGLSMSQSISGGVDDEGQGGYGLGSGVSLSGSTRGLNGTSFAGLSFSHSFTVADVDEEEIESESLFATLNISRNQNINRLSAATLNGTMQWSHQTVENQDDTDARSANANASYRHSRAFGIYSLAYDSAVGYSLVFNPGEEKTDSLSWTNSFRYFVGLLDLALDIDFYREGNDTERASLRFRATRSF